MGGEGSNQPATSHREGRPDVFNLVNEFLTPPGFPDDFETVPAEPGKISMSRYAEIYNFREKAKPEWEAIPEGPEGKGHPLNVAIKAWLDQAEVVLSTWKVEDEKILLEKMLEMIGAKQNYAKSAHEALFYLDDPFELNNGIWAHLLAHPAGDAPFVEKAFPAVYYSELFNGEPTWEEVRKNFSIEDLFVYEPDVCTAFLLQLTDDYHLKWILRVDNSMLEGGVELDSGEFVTRFEEEGDAPTLIKEKYAANEGHIKAKWLEVANHWKALVEAEEVEGNDAEPPSGE